MRDFVKIGRLDEFPEGTGRAVCVDGRRVAVFHVGGKVHALQDACPHMGAALSEGRLEPGRIVCHWHGYAFDLDTGEGSDRIWNRAQVYETRVRDDTVYLRLPPPEPEPAPRPADEDSWVVFDPERHLRSSPAPQQPPGEDESDTDN